MSRVLEDTLVRFERPLPGDRRHQVLRPGRGQGRRRLPQPAAQPGRPGLLRADRQLAAAGDRQHHPGPARRLREHRRADDLGGDRTGRGGAGAERRRDQGRLALLRDDGPAAGAGRRRSSVAERAAGGAERDRLPGSAGGRAHGRGRGAGGEPRSAGRAPPPSSTSTASARARARCRRWRSSCSRSRCSATRTRSRTSRSWSR